MPRYSGNDSWDESSYEPRRSRPDHRADDSDEEDLRIARGAQPSRLTRGSRSGGSNYNAYGSGYPPSRSSRPSQPAQVRYDAYDDDDEEPRARPGRGAGSSTYNQVAYSDDEHDEPRGPPSRSRPLPNPERIRQAAMSRGPQASRGSQSSRNSWDDAGDAVSCPSDVHIGLENHILSYQDGVGFWDSRRAAEVAAQCAEQCYRIPREYRQLRQVNSGVWSLTYCDGGPCEVDRQERRMGSGGGRRGIDSRTGGDGSRPTRGGGGYWIS